MRNYDGYAVAILLITITQISCYKILFMSPVGSPSHRIAFDPVIMKLAQLGHEITYVSGYEQFQDSPNVHNFQIPNITNFVENLGQNYFGVRLASVYLLPFLYDTYINMVVATYKFSLVVDILENPLDSELKPKFDLLVVDASSSEFTLPLAQRMGIPAVYLNSCGLFTVHAWSLNIPHPYSYIPSMIFDYPLKMNFVDRLQNTAFNLVYMWLRNNCWFPKLDSIIRQTYPGARPITELESEVSLMITNSHFSFHTPMPSMPYLIEAGGMHLTPAKKLPKDLEDFMNESPHGVVYFSFGSSIDGSIIPIEMRKKLLESFSKLKENVLFRSKSSFEGLPSNVKIIKWAPQNDLLGHPKMKLFISHGGGLSMMESAYHGVPKLAFPLTIDQFGQMVYAKDKGFAEVLDWKTFTLEELDDKLHVMLNSKRYADNAAKVSRFIKDRPQHPKDMAAYWIEYVIRHKGAPHLKSGAENLNIFQYFLLDIIGASILVFFIFISIVFLLWRRVRNLSYDLILITKKKIKLKIM